MRERAITIKRQSNIIAVCLTRLIVIAQLETEQRAIDSLSKVQSHYKMVHRLQNQAVG
jgi:hypothetical protein